MAVQDKIHKEPTVPSEKQAMQKGLPDHLTIPVPSSDSKAPVESSLTTDNPWDMMTDRSEAQGPAWAEISTAAKFGRALTVICKLGALCCLLYVFFISLDFLSCGFRLLGGKTAGEFFRNSEHLKNPVVGLMLGILATVLVQSSSTSTSIIVTMVASNFLDVRTAIPIVMGANIGTSVTNTLVSLAQSTDRSEFRRAFAGATVHDMFNWLTVIVLLPLEVATGYLFHLTSAVVNSLEMKTQKNANKEMLSVITKPFTDLIIQLDKKVINGIAIGDERYANKSLIKEWCKFEKRMVYTNITNETVVTTWLNGEVADVLKNVTTTKEHYENVGVERCAFLFNNLELGDMTVGLILLALSLVCLCTCLVLMVKVLHSMLSGSLASIVRRTLNSDLPGRFGFLTGYLALAVGCGMTILVQSSSIFTSALTPLVGIGVISVERVYPLTLGSNIGTTTTSLLASFAASGKELQSSIQIALCHLFFNISGILLFYPIPVTRIPISLAKGLGNITAKYRWFSVFYLLLMFFLVPAAVFSLSMAGPIAMAAIGGPIVSLIFIICVINVIQRKKPGLLPPCLRTWERFPKWMRSLEPWDRIIVRIKSCLGPFCDFCSCCRKGDEKEGGNLANVYGNHNRQFGLTPNASGAKLCISAAPSIDGIDNPMIKQSITAV